MCTPVFNSRIEVYYTMLQLKQISQILSQVLGKDGSGPFSASLLSNKGLPLTTVTCSGLGESITPDNLRIYSLSAINSFHQQPKFEDLNLDSWAVVDLDGTLKAMVQKFDTAETAMFVVLFYNTSYADAKAKVQLDGVTKALVSGLEGYKVF